MKEQTKCDFCVFGPTCMAHEPDSAACDLFYVPLVHQEAYEAFLASMEVSSDG